MITKSCVVCKKKYQVLPYRSDTSRFCGFVCSGKWHALNRLNKLPHDWMIGNQINAGRKPANAFTSEQVRGNKNPRWVDPIKITCTNCGTIFEQKPWLVRQNKTKTGFKFCSQKCKGEYMRGENNPLYVGGEMTYRGRNWKDQRAKAIKRDNGKCQDCKKKMGDSIPVHHIRPFREFASVEEANHLENLICLCQSCHMKRERIFPLKKI